jgi:hypothetical protein
VQVTVNGQINAMPWANVFHVRYPGTAPQVTDLNALCTAMLSAWGTNFAPLVNTNVSLSGAVASDLTNASAAQGSASASTAGTRAGTALPNNIACCITWKINMRYRGGHPRTYLPATVSADVATGRLYTQAYIDLVTPAAAAFRTAVNGIAAPGGTYTMVCLRRTIDRVAQNPAVPVTIQSSLVDHRVDSQRDRLGKDLPV